MQYKNTVTGTFLSRKNRFIAHVLIDNKETVCHVKNTGRLRELLYPGVPVILEFHPDAKARGRKTAYSLITVYKEQAGFSKERLPVNIDSQAPNQAVWEWLLGGGFSPDITKVRREVTYGSSRFDISFFIGDKPALMEVKGVTLEFDGNSRFPDAPTERGVKHVTELINACADGYESYILFAIQMKGIRSFTPNKATHPQFADILLEADKAGVHILAYDCDVTENSMQIGAPVAVCL